MELQEMKVTAKSMVSAAVIKHNILRATSTPPFIQMLPNHSKTALIVGSGPSLCLDISTRNDLKEHAKLPDHSVFAGNQLPAWLHRVQQVETSYHVMVDPQSHLKDWAQPGGKAVCIYATQCSPGVTSIADYLFHAQAVMGSTVGLQMLWVAWVLGYRSFRLYGMDSCITEGWTHFNNGMSGQVINVELDDGQQFVADAWMILQAQEYEALARRYIEGKCKIEVVGKGLLPAIHKRMMEAINGLSNPN